jgi:hypothetical protein
MEGSKVLESGLGQGLVVPGEGGAQDANRAPIIAGEQEEGSTLAGSRLCGPGSLKLAERQLSKALRLPVAAP